MIRHWQHPPQFRSFDANVGSLQPSLPRLRRGSAMADLEQKLRNRESEKSASKKKAHRDWATHNTPIIRTYDFKSQTVKDHRTKKNASIKEVLIKGKFDLISL